jgi:hypothetical protein
MAPVALDALMERARIHRDEGRWLTAAIRAEIWNVNLDREQHPELLTAADFMPGAKNSQEISDREFIDRIQAGEKFETPPEQIAGFHARFEAQFSGVESTSGEVSTVGPSGRPEPIMTNAIAGESPRRGVN